MNHKHIVLDIFLVSAFATIFVGQGCSGDLRSSTQNIATETIEPPQPLPPLPPPPPPPVTSKGVPIIVAQGFVGRTTISCDDGKTWISNRSFDLEGHDLACFDKTPVRCGETSCKNRVGNGCFNQTPCDCVHGTGYGKGVAIGQSQILANFGWGYPGTVLRSLDGSFWKESLAVPEALYPNIVFGMDRFILFSAFKPMASDDGLAWKGTQVVDPNGGGRATTFLDYQGGRFIQASDGNIIRYSSDRGETWKMATSIPTDCTRGIGTSQKIITGNGIAVMISDETQSACRSADGGNTWTLHRFANVSAQEGIVFQVGSFANGEFLAWGLIYAANNGAGNGVRFSSKDGINWIQRPTHGRIWIGSNGVSVKGTLIASNGHGYEKQALLRSEDNGLTWTEVPTTNFKQSHPFTRFESGYVAPNTLCK